MRRRNCQICNLKALLLICVVLGHALERDIPYNATVAVLYRVLYLFHMPLFAFVSGLGMKRGQAGLRQARQTGKQYLCAQGLVLLVCALARPDDLSALLVRPYWHLWYLLSLACWNCLAVGMYWLLARIGRENGSGFGVLLIFLAAGLLAGNFSLIGRDFSLSRTLVFFPFYWAGALWGKKIIDRVSRAYWMVPLALSLAVIGYFYIAKLPISFLYQAQGYSSLGLDGRSGIQARLICYLAAMACSVLVLFVCPKRKSVLTQLGGDTLMPYLLHPLFIGCLEFFPYSPQYAILVSMALTLTAVTCIHLCFKWRRPIFIFTNPASHRQKLGALHN